MQLLLTALLSISLFAFNTPTDEKKAKYSYIFCTADGEYSENLNMVNDSTYECGLVASSEKTSMVQGITELYTQPKALQNNIKAFLAGEWNLDIKEITFKEVSLSNTKAWLVNCTFENDKKLKILFQKYSD